MEPTLSRRKHLTRAALVSGCAEVVGRLLMAVLSIAVARALQPAEVGVLSLGVIVVGVLSLIASGAETASVASRGDGTDCQYAFGAFIVRALLTAFGAFAMFTFLPLVAGALTGREQLDEQFTKITTILAWQLACELAGSYPRAILQRRLDLSYLAGVTLFQTITHVCLSFLVLASGSGLVALAWASVASAGVVVPVLWGRLLHHHLMVWEGTGVWSLWRRLASATVRVLMAGVVSYLNGRIDNLLVAGAIGPTAMSFYALAWNMSRFVPVVISQVFSSILVPTLAELGSDTRRVGQVVSETLRHVYLLLAPFCALAFVSAPTVVETVLGEKWAPLVPCFRVMMITIVVTPAASMFFVLLLVTGRAHLIAVATFAQLMVLIGLMVPLVHSLGLIGAAYVDLVAMLVMTILLWVAVPQHYRSLLQSPLASALRTGACAAVVGAGAWIVGQQAQTGAFREAVHVGFILSGYPMLLAMVGGRSLISDAGMLLSLGIRRGS